MKRLAVMGLTDDRRRRWASILMHVGWWGSLILTIMDVSNVLPRSEGVLIVLLIGIAIAASSARSRMLLGDSVVEAMQTGLTASAFLQTNIVSNACTVETNVDGCILFSDQAELIGWGDDDLKGLSIIDLIPDYCLRLYVMTAKQFREQESRASGVTINISICGQDQSERSTRMTMAKIGDSFVYTFVPTGMVGSK